MKALRRQRRRQAHRYLRRYSGSCPRSRQRRMKNRKEYARSRAFPLPRARGSHCLRQRRQAAR